MFASVLSVTGGRAESRSWSWVYIALFACLKAARMRHPRPPTQLCGEFGLKRSVAHGVVVEPPLLHALDRTKQLVVIALVVHRVDGRGVHDEQRRVVVLMEEARIGFVQSCEVLTIDRLLVRDAALGNSFQQH